MISKCFLEGTGESIRAAKAYDINRALGNCEHFSKTAWKIINNFSRDRGSNKCSKSIAIQINILGPLLFLFYVGGLNSVIQHGKLVQYADDTTLCFKSKSIQELEITSFMELNTCIQYFNEMNQKTNQSKTIVVNFSLRQYGQIVRPAVFMDDNFLEENNSTKFLGMKD
ncbi:hypothetical protein J6590_003920 [Homalodisca vitripennis]|nr:hypothetical protein J6590_003920 [Homalodisca vitripennis]